MSMMTAEASAAVRLPTSAGDPASLVRVSGGCTIGFHPGPFGYCVQNGYAPPDVNPLIVPADPATRACPPGFHPGLFGLACVAD